MKLRLSLVVVCLLVVHSSSAQGLNLLGLKLDLNSVLSPLGLGARKQVPAAKTNNGGESVTAKPEVPVDDDETVVREARQVNLGVTKPAATNSIIPDDAKPAAPEAANPPADEAKTVAPEATKAVDEANSAAPAASTPVVEDITVPEETKGGTDENSTAVPEEMEPVGESPSAAPEVAPPAPEKRIDASKPAVDETNSTAAPEKETLSSRLGSENSTNTAPTLGPPPAPIICKRNEVYSEFKNPCPISCDQPYLRKCKPIDEAGCNCKTGYFRDSLDRCILPIFCRFDKIFPWLKRMLFDRPQTRCGRNAEYVDCSNFCVKTCSFPDRECVPPPMDLCITGCKCKKDYVLNAFAQCVRPQDC